jgi:hypothetical protein
MRKKILSINHSTDKNPIPTIGPFNLLSLLLLFSLSLSPICLMAQSPIDYIQTDSLPVKKIKKKKQRKSLKQFLKEDYPSPKKAVLLAIVPGMGQIYNKKFWKLPLVYGALGGVIYAIDYNTRNYKLALKSIEAKNNHIPMEQDPYPTTPISAVEARRNSLDKNRQLSWIGLVGFYLISAGDAFVDAHLKGFNVNDDLSFRPTINSDFNKQPILGFGVNINISK